MQNLLRICSTLKVLYIQSGNFRWQTSGDFANFRVCMLCFGVYALCPRNRFHFVEREINFSVGHYTTEFCRGALSTTFVKKIPIGIVANVCIMFEFVLFVLMRLFTFVERMHQSFHKAAYYNHHVIDNTYFIFMCIATHHCANCHVYFCYISRKE